MFTEVNSSHYSCAVIHLHIHMRNRLGIHYGLLSRVLSCQNSPLLLKNDGYTSSELVISDSESPGGIKEKNTVIQDLNRNAASKSSSGYENPRTSSIPKVLHCV
ncbi:hypothetical protein AVEN_12337-1, partial [Araneus ventricosus]